MIEPKPKQKNLEFKPALCIWKTHFHSISLKRDSFHLRLSTICIPNIKPKWEFFV